MPPALAALLTFAFIFFLFRLENQRREASGALWVPVLWMLITGSRFPTQWINLGTYGVDQEGTPLDVIYFLTLIIMGLRILALRNINIGKLLKNNTLLSAFFIYSFLSIAWSDFPFIAFKRYIKIIAHPVMALIILSDPYPANAFRTVIKRCAYLLIPLSVLFIKYYPQYGRGFDGWSGAATNNGAMLTKSELGIGCMIYGIFFYWNVLNARHIEDRIVKREEILVSLIFLVLIGWLLKMAHSSTALVTFLVGAGTITVLSLNIVSRRFFGTYFIVSILMAAGIEMAFDVYAKILELLGEDPTLTDRTKVWADCIALVNNPLIGEGFESFWLGPRLDILWEKWWWRPNQAHNGYIETYLNFGVIGVFLIVGLIIATFRKISNDLLKDFDFAQLRLALLFAIILVNFVEATFKGVALAWTIFHIIAIDYPRDTQPIKTQKTHVPKKKGLVFHRYKQTL